MNRKNSSFSLPAPESRDSAETSPPVPGDDATGPAIDLGVIEGLSKLYPETAGGPVDQMVRSFLANTEAHLARIQQAVDEGDLAELEQTAHTLRGSSGSLGARRLSTLSRRIELEARDHGRIVSSDRLVELFEEFERVRQAFSSTLS